MRRCSLLGRVAQGRGAQGRVPLAAFVPLAAALCLLAGIGIIGTARPAAAAPPSAPVPAPRPSRSAAPPGHAAADAKAAAAAKVSGKRVEVMSRRSATAQTFANPNGTFTLEQYVEPVRVRRPDGSWTPMDTTLRRGRDGLIRPGATTVPLAFSGGGTAPLVQQGAAGNRLSVSWPDSLPAPTINGATLTYPKVFPGVDLRVTAYPGEFTATLVVSSRQAAADAALRRISLPLRGDGESVRADGTGGLAAVDRSGRVRFRLAAPQVWDSTRRADSTRTRRGGGRLSMTAGRATLAPDVDALAAPGVTFPAYADILAAPVDCGPAPTSCRHWTMMDAAHPNQSYWAGTSSLADSDRQDCPAGWGGHYCPKVGQAYGSDPDTYRSLFDFDTSALGHKDIIGAQFGINLAWSPDNTDRPVELWSTGPIGPGTTWNNTSFFLWQDTRSSHGWQIAPPGRLMEFNALAAMRDVSGRAGPTLTLGLKAANEGDELQWKKFDAASAHLSVNYNSYPATPDQMSTDYNWCDNGWIKSTTPTLRVHAHDDDSGQPLLMAFAWGRPDGNGGWTVIGSGNQTSVPSDTIAQLTVPAGQLPDGGTYAWWAQANDGRDNSAQTGRCVFQIDATAPAPPKALESPDYPDDGRNHGQVGQPGTFSITPPDSRPDDVAAYVYGPNSAPSADATIPAAADKTATVRYTPDRDGPNHFYVWAKDKAGNLSDVAHPLVYDFGVNPGAGPVGRWSLENGSGTTATDGSGHGHDLTLSGAAAWAPGRTGAGLRFDGTTGAATSAAAVVPTNQNYTVSAWARITDVGETRTLVSQSGTVNSAMRLQYRADDDRWTFGAASADTSGATRVRATSVAPPQVGVWTHLLGEYDAANQQVRLYVNGVLEGTAPYSTAWDATGPLTVGSSLWDGSRTDYWAGDVDDVRVWDRTLAPDEVLNAYSNLPTLIKIPVSRATGSTPCAADETPDKAVDGVVTATSKFCSSAPLPWLQLDLSADRTISEVVVRHAEAGGEPAGTDTRDFDVRTSANGTDWKTVLKVRGNTRAVSRLSLPSPVTAAFLKINIISPTQTSDAAARIDEVEVYGMTASLTNAAAGRPVTASPATPCGPTEDRGNATDGSLTTKWCGMRGSGDLRLEVDLGEVTPIWWVSLANAEAGGEAAGYNSRDYDIQVSTDGTTWVPVDQTRGNVTAVSGHALVPSIGARYVRVVLLNPTQGTEQTARIYELQVYSRG
jgi:hypothetical protein